MLDSQDKNDYNENNFKIDVEKRERKYSWSTVFAWLYLNTIGKILPKKWNKWAENILNPYEVTTRPSSSGFTGLEEGGQSKTTGAELNPQETTGVKKDNQSQTVEEEFNLQPNETTEEEKKILANCIESQKREIDKLTEKLENSNKEIGGLNSRIEELYSNLNGLLQELEITKRELEIKHIELKALQEAADKTAQDYGNRIPNLLNEISALKNKLDAATAREEKMHELEKDDNESKNKLISEQNKVNLLQNKLTALRKENKELKHSLDETKGQQGGYKKQLENAVQNLRNGQASEKNKIQEQLKARIIELENESNDTKESNQKLQEKLEQQIKQLEIAKKQLEDAVQNPQNEHASEKNKIQEQLEARIRELEQKLSDQLKGYEEHVRHDAINQNEKISEKNKIQKQLEAKVIGLTDDLLRLKAENEKMQTELDRLNKSNQQLQQKPDIIPPSTKTQSNQPKNSHSAIDTSKLNYPCLNGGKCHGDLFEGEKLYASVRLGAFAEFSKFLTDCNKEIKSKENGRFCNTKKLTTFNLLNRNSKNSVFSGKSIFHNAVERTIKCLLHRDDSVFSKSELHDIFTYSIHKLIKNEMSSLTDKYNANLFLREIEGLIEELVSKVEKEFLKEVCDFELENVGYKLKKEVMEKCQSPNSKIDSPKIGRMSRRISTQSTP